MSVFAIPPNDEMRPVFCNSAQCQRSITPDADWRCPNCRNRCYYGTAPAICPVCRGNCLEIRRGYKVNGYVCDACRPELQRAAAAKQRKLDEAQQVAIQREMLRLEATRCWVAKERTCDVKLSEPKFPCCVRCPRFHGEQKTWDQLRPSPELRTASPTRDAGFPRPPLQDFPAEEIEFEDDVA